MNIAVFHHLPDGGAKVALFEHLRRLKDNHQLDLFTLISEESEFDLKPLCKRVFLYPYETTLARQHGVARVVGDLRSLSTFRALHRQIAADIDAGGYDLAYIHQSRLIHSPYLLRYLHTPSYYFCQEPLRMVYEYGLRLKEDVTVTKKVYEVINRVLRKRIDRTNARRAFKILTASRFSHEYVSLAYDVDPLVCPLGVDTQVFKPRSGMKRNGMLFIGTPTASKGYDLIVASLKLLSKNEQPLLRSVTPRDHQFTLTRGELIQEYSSCEATFCVSRLEPFGMVALESMACETPVIAVNEGGFRETVVDGKTGYLINRSPQELADKIRMITRNSDATRTMGRQARRHVEKNWSWERSIEILERIFSQGKSAK